MTIEFHVPAEALKDTEINYIRDQLIAFHKKEPKISRVELYAKEHKVSINSFSCEIHIIIYGNSIKMQRNADSYFKAAKLTLKALSQKIDLLVMGNKTPPDQVTSSVKV